MHLLIVWTLLGATTSILSAYPPAELLYVIALEEISGEVVTINGREI